MRLQNTRQSCPKCLPAAEYAASPDKFELGNIYLYYDSDGVCQKAAQCVIHPATRPVRDIVCNEVFSLAANSL